MGSLSGIKVIDLSRVLGGPYCTQMLADHGADVIKIEPPQGDETRGWGPPFKGDAASYFIGVNRNKRGAALDLSQTGGREVLLTLLEKADVLVENFKTGTLEKWGLGYDEVLSARFPRLVHCRISGFGADGPLGGLPGYDAVAQGMSGLMSVNGDSDSGPLRMGVPVIDIAAGMNAAIGILMALQERTRSGKGQFVEATLYDSGIAMMHPHLPNYYLSGKLPKRSGNAHPNICPYDAFDTRTTPIFLAVGNDDQFRRLGIVIGLPGLAQDERFRSNRDRLAHASALRETLLAAFAERDGMVLAEELMHAGVPCGPVLDVEQVVSHPHTLHRGMRVEFGEYCGTGSPVKLSRTPAAMRSEPPQFGSDTVQVLREAGLAEDVIENLIKQGIACAGAAGQAGSAT